MYPKRATLEGSVGDIFKLVSRGATPEQWAEWLRVPLEHAAAAGNIDLCNALIGAGVNSNAGWRGCHGRTLFDAAALGGSADVVSALVLAGAQPDVKVVSASSGRSALYLATSLGHEEAARRLVMAGADVHFVDLKDKYTVLVKAVQGGHEQLVNDLLLCGANPNPGNRYVGIPLPIAARCGSVRMVSDLLARGAEKDEQGLGGDTPLIKAAAAGHLAVVRTLLDAGADVELRSIVHSSMSALGWAAMKGHVAVMKAILERGAKVNAVDEFGVTALHTAAIYNQEGAIDALIEAGADIELKNEGTNTPLNETAAFARWGGIRGLLKHGANTNVCNDDGNSPLHKVCCTKARGVDVAVDLLLRFGADENAANQLNETPAAALSKQGPFVRVSLRAPPQELERARLLLARAEEDRVWRRRGWLVMLRSRAVKVNTNYCRNDDGGGYVTSAGDERGKRVGPKVARTGHVEGDGAGVLGLGSSCVVGTGGEEENVRALVVSLLLDMGIDGVFRTLVGFM